MHSMMTIESSRTVWDNWFASRLFVRIEAMACSIANFSTDEEESTTIGTGSLSSFSPYHTHGMDNA